MDPAVLAIWYAISLVFVLGLIAVFQYHQRESRRIQLLEKGIESNRTILSQNYEVYEKGYFKKIIKK